MAYYATKTSILSGAVPTDGVMYYAGNNTWSNQSDNKTLYDTEDECRAEVAVERIGLGAILPTGVQIVSE
jgi:hypothetical protein